MDNVLVHNKLKDLILYISFKSSDDIFFGRIKLFKLIFFIDFTAYRRLGETITGETYHKEPCGPVGDTIRDAFHELIQIQELTEMVSDVYGREQYKPISKTTPNLDVFSKEEILVIEDVIDSYRNLNASQLSELSHSRIPAWEKIENRAPIPVSISLMCPTDEMEKDDLAQIGKELKNKMDKGELDTNALPSPI